jgi:rfaE bifunctional protein nucleotidyltransferase chain/domain
MDVRRERINIIGIGDVVRRDWDNFDLSIVLCHGCWDKLHLGHIRHLQEARKLGDKLVVSVTADKWVHKGIGRPYFTAEQRAEALLALECVDEVIINDDEGAWDLIRQLRPKFYVKGVDYVGIQTIGLQKEREAVLEVGGQIKFTSTSKWSSSQLINTERFTPEICEYLDGLKKLDAKDNILEAFQRADDRVITFVGETITDVYRYVQGLGRASKELMLATVETGMEAFNGGVLAAAKHAEWKNVHVVTAGNIIKTRYVDRDFNKKLFDVYSATDVDLPHDKRHEFRELLEDAVPSSAVVIVNDFGHGLMGDIERGIVQHAGFLALNCQTNAGNYGFNPVTKYEEARYICIDEPEARLAAGTQTEPMPHAVQLISTRMKCKKFLITHGRFGSYDFDGRDSTHHPAFVSGGVDTMGAGDAVMAVTAPLVAAGLQMQFAAFVGNIVGAIKLSILGHRRHVGRQEIIQTVEALLA